MWWKSAVNLSFLLSLATCRMRSSACDTLTQLLRPARALLVRIPLGPRPSLHRLRRIQHHRRSLWGGLFRFVRRLPSYYDKARLLGSVHHRLRFLTFPMRTIVLRTHSTPMARPETSQVPVRSLCT